MKVRDLVSALLNENQDAVVLGSEVQFDEYVLEPAIEVEDTPVRSKADGTYEYDRPKQEGTVVPAVLIRLGHTHSDAADAAKQNQRDQVKANAESSTALDGVVP